MLLIACPWCGPRDETEFHAGGEAGRIRPIDPDRLDDGEWADFLFMRRNEKGLRRERWLHAMGCRRWFTISRDTTTHDIMPEPAGSAPPPAPPFDGAGR